MYVRQQNIIFIMLISKIRKTSVAIGGQRIISQIIRSFKNQFNFTHKNKFRFFVVPSVKPCFLNILAFGKAGSFGSLDTLPLS